MSSDDETLIAEDETTRAVVIRPDAVDMIAALPLEEMRAKLGEEAQVLFRESDNLEKVAFFRPSDAIDLLVIERGGKFETFAKTDSPPTV